MIDHVSVGHISGQHGVHGHLKISSSENIENIKKGTWLFLIIQNKPVPFFIEECWGDSEMQVVKLRGIDSREHAIRYVGLGVGLEPAAVSASERDIPELLGYKVIDSQSNTIIGEIEDLFDNSAHMLLQIRDQEREYLLPLHEELIVQLDDRNKTLTLQIPEGLLDL